jgi:hypothetical protein
MREEIIQYERKISKVGRSSWMLIIDKSRLERLGYQPGDTLEKIVITAQKPKRKE